MSGATRWLVTGALGQLGSELVAALRGEPEVTPVGRAELDITSAAVGEAVRRWARGGDPARLVVLNAAAWTDVDGAERDPAAAERANILGPDRLASACHEVGATLVHVSTDYVFPGRPVRRPPRPYEVNDPVGPRTVYGVTKEAGERAVRQRLASHYIVRTSWLYGAVGGNFVKTIARLRHRRDTLDVVDDQRGSPTWAGELGPGLVALAGSGAPHGTYHCAGSGEASWFELARAVFEELGANPDRIRPCDSSAFPRPATRPAYSVLSGSAWTAAGLPPRRHWREALHTAFRVSRTALDPPL